LSTNPGNYGSKKHINYYIVAIILIRLNMINSIYLCVYICIVYTFAWQDQ
jgi:hypothetical protein